MDRLLTLAGPGQARHLDDMPQLTEVRVPLTTREYGQIAADARTQGIDMAAWFRRLALAILEDDTAFNM